MVARCGTLLLIILSALYAPVWVTLLLCILGFFFFPTFIEGLLVLLAMDFTYGVPQDRFLMLPLIHFSIGLVSFFILSVIKKKLLVR